MVFAATIAQGLCDRIGVNGEERLRVLTGYRLKDREGFSGFALACSCGRLVFGGSATAAAWAVKSCFWPDDHYPRPLLRA
jgi:hypothetical protein